MEKMTEIRNSYVEVIRNSEKTQNRHIQVPQNHGKTELEIGNYAWCLDVCHPIAPVLQDPFAIPRWSWYYGMFILRLETGQGSAEARM